MYHNINNKRSVEEICYEEEHIDKILKEIRVNISHYFSKYVKTEAGRLITQEEVKKLSNLFGSSEKPTSKNKDIEKVLKLIVDEAVIEYKSDEMIYKNILNLEALAEYELDVPSFKNKVLHDQIPIIRKTLRNRLAEKLDKYRKAFKNAQPGDLFQVVKNIIEQAEEWHSEWYDTIDFEKITTCEELGYHDLDDLGYPSVIGGGIKSHFIYKLYPEMYPNRSREAIWSLYYLSDKKTFGCKEESEFLMIDKQKGITQQNYFYPYALFSFYALQIFLELKKLNVYYISMESNYRFIAVDSFLSFVAWEHRQEIELLTENPNDADYEY